MTLTLIAPCEETGFIWTTSGGATIDVGRTGNCWKCQGGSGSAQFSLPQPRTETITLGFAWKPTVASGRKYAPPVLALLADDASSGIEHLYMEAQVDNSLTLHRSGSVQVAQSATGLVVANVWHYIEVQARIHATAGFCTVRLNGTQIMTYTGATYGGGTVAADRVGFGEGQGGFGYFDDVYVCQTTGATPDPFLGDSEVVVLVPNGDGAANQWVGSDGNSTANWQLVDELPASATDYVQSDVTGQQDLYTTTDLVPTTGAIRAVAVVAYAGKTDVGPRSIKGLVRRTTTTAATAVALPDATFRANTFLWLTDPETGAAWTQANVNALQVGVEVV